MDPDFPACTFSSSKGQSWVAGWQGWLGVRDSTIEGTFHMWGWLFSLLTCLTYYLLGVFPEQQTSHLHCLLIRVSLGDTLAGQTPWSALFKAGYLELFSSAGCWVNGGWRRHGFSMAMIGWMEQGWIGACGNRVWMDGGRKAEWVGEWWRVDAQMEERHRSRWRTARETMGGWRKAGWIKTDR